MRLTDLLGRTVVDANGSTIGGVADVVLVQDGPMLGPHAASFRIAGLVVVQHRHTQLLGYERDVRPAPFRALVRRMAGEVYNVPWDHVVGVNHDKVSLTVQRRELDAHDPSLRR